MALLRKGVQERPQEGVDLANKRVAVIGTGASGVQTIQDSGLDAKQVVVCQRTPKYAIPINQKKLAKEDARQMKDEGGFEKAFKSCYTTSPASRTTSRRRTLSTIRPVRSVRCYTRTLSRARRLPLLIEHFQRHAL